MTFQASSFAWNPNGTLRMTLDASGNLLISSTTPSLGSASAGSIQTTGGIAIAKDLYVGTTATIAGTLTVGGLQVLTSLSSVSEGSTSTAASGVGYMGTPQNSKSGAYTTVIGDAGKHIYVTTTATITIDSNANVAYPIGTTLGFIAAANATVTIAITTDTLYMGGTGQTGSKTLYAFGMASAVKIAATSWFISGNGLV
jgi:hypothetical protein